MGLSPTTERKKWTEAELQALPDDGFDCDLIAGELVLSPKPGAEHSIICIELAASLFSFSESRKLGAVLSPRTGFWMKNGNCRSPDISFVSKERLRGMERPARGFFQFAPGLAVEVLSRYDTRAEIQDRLKDYFSSGTELVWIIDPETKSAEICYSLEKRRLVSPNGELNGEDVMPGFRYKLADLFQEWEWD